MKPSVYPVPLAEPGRLYVLPKPSGEWLREDLGHLRGLGADVVVSLLEPGEAEELGLQTEAAICAEQGMDFLNLPVADRGVPGDAAAFQTMARHLAARVRAGSGVAIHCRAGIGRAGMAASCVLAALGVEAEEAIARVGQARGVAVPDTPAQREFILRAAKSAG